MVAQHESESNNSHQVVAAREIYTNNLLDIMTPVMMQRITAAHAQIIDSPADSQRMSHLRRFQEFMRGIPQWSSHIVEVETDEFYRKADAKLIEDLITTVIVSNAEILSSINIAATTNKIHLKIPRPSVFVHQCYIELARKLYKNILIFADKTDSSEKQRDMEKLRGLTQEAIRLVIQKSLPIQEIMKQFVTAGDVIDDSKRGLIDDIQDPEVAERLLNDQKSMEKQDGGAISTIKDVHTASDPVQLESLQLIGPVADNNAERNTRDVPNENRGQIDEKEDGTDASEIRFPSPEANNSTDDSENRDESRNPKFSNDDIENENEDDVPDRKLTFEDVFLPEDSESESDSGDHNGSEGKAASQNTDGSERGLSEDDGEQKSHEHPSELFDIDEDKDDRDDGKLESSANEEDPDEAEPNHKLNSHDSDIGADTKNDVGILKEGVQDSDDPTKDELHIEIFDDGDDDDPVSDDEEPEIIRVQSDSKNASVNDRDEETVTMPDLERQKSDASSTNDTKKDESAHDVIPFDFRFDDEVKDDDGDHSDADSGYGHALSDEDDDDKSKEGGSIGNDDDYLSDLTGSEIDGITFTDDDLYSDQEDVDNLLSSIKNDQNEKESSVSDAKKKPKTKLENFMGDLAPRQYLKDIGRTTDDSFAVPQYSAPVLVADRQNDTGSESHPEHLPIAVIPAKEKRRLSKKLKKKLSRKKKGKSSKKRSLTKKYSRKNSTERQDAPSSKNSVERSDPPLREKDKDKDKEKSTKNTKNRNNDFDIAARKFYDEGTTSVDRSGSSGSIEDKPTEKPKKFKLFADAPSDASSDDSY